MKLWEKRAVEVVRPELVLEEVAEHHQGLFHAASRQTKVRLLDDYCSLQVAMDFSAVVFC